MSVFGRCVPQSIVFGGRSLVDSAEDIANDLIKNSCSESGSTLDTVIKDFYASWRYVVGLIGASFGASFLIIVLLRFIVGIFVWLMLTLLVLLMLGGGIYLIILSEQYRNKEDATSTDRTYATWTYVLAVFVIGCLLSAASSLR